MGSVVVSDVVPEFARYPRTMVVGDHHDTGHGRSRTSSARSTISQAPPAPYPHPRTASSSSSSSAISTQTTVGPSPAGPDRPATQGNAPSNTAPEAHRASTPQVQPQTVAGNEVQSGDGLGQTGGPPLSGESQGELPAQSPPSPRLLPTIRSSLSMNGGNSPPLNRIKVRDLNHIQTFASEEVLTRSRYGSRRSLRERQDGGQKYEISAMPVTDIIEMVAGLLTKMTTTNDRQHENMHRQIPSTEDASGLGAQTSSVLSFHGKNVPSITILSYLSRIHKYCPTTYEVFLSLLVYFDRMTETINKGTVHSFRNMAEQPETENGAAQNSTAAGMSTPPPSSSDAMEAQRPLASARGEDDNDKRAAHFFVVDSFNIHRLVIAGVTCASKFFSDVFYTNSRYAKVGGLPIHELNHLELQFLLLNDFKLSVPVEELEAYGSMLVGFYAKEVMAQHMGSEPEALYLQTPTPTPPA